MHPFSTKPWLTPGLATIEIPIAVVNGSPGPAVLFTGGVHGDEYEGPIAVRNVHMRLVDGAYTCGQLNAVNPPTDVVGEKTLLGVGAGDRVVVYMPMVPEAAIAMLACARIGAVHSVVFGGFAADAVRAMIVADGRVDQDEAENLVLLEALLGLKARGATVVIVTHRMSTLAAADKVMVLTDGTLAAFGPRDEVFKPTPATTTAPSTPNATPANRRVANVVPGAPVLAPGAAPGR